jgi:hypothetical protein
MISDLGVTISSGKGATIVLTGPTVNISGEAFTVGANQPDHLRADRQPLNIIVTQTRAAGA